MDHKLLKLLRSVQTKMKYAANAASFAGAAVCLKAAKRKRKILHNEAVIIILN